MSDVLKIAIIQKGTTQDISIPAYQTEGAAGLDLQAAIGRTMTIAPGDRQLIPTGLRMAIPTGYEGQVRPRSGLAFKHGITVLNAPGTVDSDFRGEVCVILHNAGGIPYQIKHGERIAQLVIAPVSRLPIQHIDEDGLSETKRGSGMLGSTGK